MKNMKHTDHQSVYTTFLLMLAVSAVCMYLTMYLNTFTIDHIYFSWTRMYMTLIGVGGMAIVMFLFMQKMYKNKVKNVAIILGSLAVMIISTILVKTQTPIDDVKWLKAMIPHHSTAILTSSRADIQDPEVKALANEIIQAQEREIEEMKAMIKRLENEQ